jgi:predicted anti-sigma-YlaC factor YlaD
MNCKETRDLFSDFYDRELNREICDAVKEHLAECQECKEEYGNFKKSLKFLKKLKELQAPQYHIDTTYKH